jgi:hypothetical protein
MPAIRLDALVVSSEHALRVVDGVLDEAATAQLDPATFWPLRKLNLERAGLLNATTLGCISIGMISPDVASYGAHFWEPRKL